MENSFYSRVATLTANKELANNHFNVFSVSSNLLFIKAFDSLRSLSSYYLKYKNMDLIVIDLNTIDPALVRTLRSEMTDVKIICIADQSIIFQQVMSYNINGFVSKTTDYNTLLKCVSEVCSNKRYIDPEALQSLFFEKTTKYETELTNREYEVLQELSKSLSYEQIASKLFISRDTVKKHLEHIYSKLDVKNRYMAVEKARNSLII